MAIVIAKDNTIFNCDNVASISEDGGKIMVGYDENGGPAVELTFARSASLESSILALKRQGADAKSEAMQKEAEDSILPATVEAVAAGNGADGEIKIISTMVLSSVANQN